MLLLLAGLLLWVLSRFIGIVLLASVMYWLGIICIIIAIIKGLINGAMNILWIGFVLIILYWVFTYFMHIPFFLL